MEKTLLLLLHNVECVRKCEINERHITNMEIFAHSTDRTKRGKSNNHLGSTKARYVAWIHRKTNEFSAAQTFWHGYQIMYPLSV
jgi:hypothetical protein